MPASESWSLAALTVVGFQHVADSLALASNGPQSCTFLLVGNVLPETNNAIVQRP